MARSAAPASMSSVAVGVCQPCPAADVRTPWAPSAPNSPEREFDIGLACISARGKQYLEALAVARDAVEAETPALVRDEGRVDEISTAGLDDPLSDAGCTGDDAREGPCKSGRSCLNGPAYFTLSPRSAASLSATTSLPDTPMGPSPAFGWRPVSLFPLVPGAVSTATASLSPPAGMASAPGGDASVGCHAYRSQPKHLSSPSSLEASYMRDWSFRTVVDGDQIPASCASAGFAQHWPPNGFEIPTPPSASSLPHAQDQDSEAAAIASLREVADRFFPARATTPSTCDTEGASEGSVAKGRIPSSAGSVDLDHPSEKCPEQSSAEKSRLPEFRALTVTIVKASGLREADWFGKAKVYCACAIAGKSWTRVQTKAEDSGVNPIWNESCDVYGFNFSEPLEFTVWDKGQFPKPDDLLGRAIVPCDAFYPGGFVGDIVLEGSGRLSGQATLTLDIAPASNSATFGAARSSLPDVTLLGLQASPAAATLQSCRVAPDGRIKTESRWQDILADTGRGAVTLDAVSPLLDSLSMSPGKRVPDQAAPTRCIDKICGEQHGFSESFASERGSDYAGAERTERGTRSAHSPRGESRELQVKLEAMERRLHLLERENQELREQVRELQRENGGVLEWRSKCSALEQERKVLRIAVARLERGLRASECEAVPNVDALSADAWTSAVTEPDAEASVARASTSQTGAVAVVGRSPIAGADPYQAASSAVTSPGPTRGESSPLTNRSGTSPMTSRYSMLRICENLPRNLGGRSRAAASNIQGGGTAAAST